MVFVGTIFIGMVIGEFTSLLSSYTRKQTQMNEESDIVSNVMLSLRIPEHIQRRVLDYYDEVLDGKFIKNQDLFETLSSNLSGKIKYYEIRESVMKLDFMNTTNLREIEKFVQMVSIKFYLAGDILIKQDEKNEKFFYIHKGMVEVFQHSEDFLYFDYQEVEQFKRLNGDLDGNETTFARDGTTKFLSQTSESPYKDIYGSERKFDDDSRMDSYYHNMYADAGSVSLNDDDVSQSYNFDSSSCNRVNSEISENILVDKNVKRMTVNRPKSIIIETNNQTSDNMFNKFKRAYTGISPKKLKRALTVSAKSFTCITRSTILPKTYRIINELEEGEYFGEIS